MESLVKFKVDSCFKEIIYEGTFAIDHQFEAFDVNGTQLNH